MARAADLEDPDKKAFLDNYLKAWSMGLEASYHNPLAAVRRVRAVPVGGPGQWSHPGRDVCCRTSTLSVATWTSARAGATTTWRRGEVLRHRPRLGQVKNPVKAEDVCTNACITAANDFDHDKVKADAMAIQLPADLAAVDIEAVKSHLFDQAIKG